MAFTGQGRLDIEVHLLQDDPLSSLRGLLADIRKAGGMPDVDPGLWGYARKRIRQDAVSRTPFRHTIWAEVLTAGRCLTGKARKTHMAMPNVWGSPVIKAGQDVTLTIDGNDYACTLGGDSFRVPMEDLAKRFVVDSGEACAETGSWEVRHEGRLAAFPDIAHALRSRAVRLGISGWLDWDYQLDDLIETSMGRIGAVISWAMGLGKGRLAAALCAPCVRMDVASRKENV